MGEMLLCRSRQGTEPYFVEELGLYLYTAEELSYYIYHNAALIGEDFLDERLYRFIGQDLGMENLESKLRRWSDEADLSELLLVILQDVHYYNTEELSSFRQKMAEMTRRTEGNRMRERADMLLSRGRYSGALLQYDRLLHTDCPEMQEDAFRGRVWMGCGVACARQYDWKAAAYCLEKSYGLLHDRDSLRMLCQLSLADPDLVLSERVTSALTDPKRETWEKEFAEAKERASSSGKGREAAAWQEKDNIRRTEGLKGLVEDWKSEYRRSLGTI